MELSDRERLEHLTRTLSDIDLRYDFSEKQIERMQRERAELERELASDECDGIT